MIAAGTVALALVLAGSARGPIVLELDALGPITVRVTSKVAGVPPPPIRTGDRSKDMTGLGPRERAELRARVVAGARKLLEGVGFEVREAALADEPVFAIRADVLPDACGANDWVSVPVQVEVDEAAVWVRDPSRRGHIVVWSRATTHHVRRPEGARTLEEAVLAGVREFTDAQKEPVPAGSARD